MIVFNTEHAKPKVRPYTRAEQAATHFEPGESPDEKVTRYINTYRIDRERYQEAAVTHSSMRDHFESLIEASYIFTSQIIGFMITEGQIEGVEYLEEAPVAQAA